MSVLEKGVCIKEREVYIRKISVIEEMFALKKCLLERGRDLYYRDV